MEHKDYTAMTDQELLVEKKRIKQSRLFHAVAIGFLAGILIFGVAAWSISPKKQLGFLIPMLIPVVMIYRMLKNPKQNQDLEAILKERGLA